MPQEFVLEVNLLCKKFGTFNAVDSISFGLKKGEILGLLGPNGAGKTTTIQMLLGILKQTSGTVCYFGRDLSQHREELLEKLNFSSTYTNLPWRLTVRETLTYTSYLYRISNRSDRVQQVIDTFRLAKLLSQEISELSAGQLTRLNLAKAFLNRPEVLLLDEPTASLDPETATYIRGLIQEQRKKFGVSILFTSHNMPEVEDMCDRVIFLNGGKIIAEDSPRGLSKKIKYSKLELVMVDGLKRTMQLCEELQLHYNVNVRSIVITIEEHRIAELLNLLAIKTIQYDQITIDKPNLEDFFLEVVKKNT